LRLDKRLVLCVFMISIFLIPLVSTATTAQTKPNTALINSLMDVNWNERHHIGFYDWLLHSLAEAYPKLARTYSIGHSWREQQIWCIEMSSPGGRNRKVGVAVIGNIHGGEQQSGEAAAYVAWWLLTKYESNSTARRILDNFVVYVIPVMNPDGYEQSFTYPCRSNLRPTDKNGDGIPFSDPYHDTNGDGIIARVYTGAPDSTPAQRVYLGMESPDYDNNNIPGDDAKDSGIDLNRNFDYMWERLDIDATPMIGAKTALSRAGPTAASEPEVQAIQNFLATHNIKSLETLHTGEQSVLWPWCYTADPPTDAAFMQQTAEAMAAAFSARTGRMYYTMQSYADYPTTAELIDWSYGRLGIYSYTVEVYAAGTGDYHWGNPVPSPQWVYMGHWQKWDNVWFRNTPPTPLTDQEVICAGNLESTLVMFLSVAPKSMAP
jgi:murein tripeptide amidase MpaA